MPRAGAPVPQDAAGLVGVVQVLARQPPHGQRGHHAVVVRDGGRRQDEGREEVHLARGRQLHDDQGPGVLLEHPLRELRRRGLVLAPQRRLLRQPVLQRQLRAAHVPLRDVGQRRRQRRRALRTPHVRSGAEGHDRHHRRHLRHARRHLLPRLRRAAPRRQVARRPHEDVRRRHGRHLHTHQRPHDDRERPQPRDAHGVQEHRVRRPRVRRRRRQAGQPALGVPVPQHVACVRVPQRALHARCHRQPCGGPHDAAPRPRGGVQGRRHDRDERVAHLPGRRRGRRVRLRQPRQDAPRDAGPPVPLLPARGERPEHDAVVPRPAARVDASVARRARVHRRGGHRRRRAQAALPRLERTEPRRRVRGQEAPEARVRLRLPTGHEPAADGAAAAGRRRHALPRQVCELHHRPRRAEPQRAVLHAAPQLVRGPEAGAHRAGVDERGHVGVGLLRQQGHVRDRAGQRAGHRLDAHQVRQHRRRHAGAAPPSARVVHQRLAGD
eukprot:PhM_4_TR16759/c0_g1_i1/m.26599